MFQQNEHAIHILNLKSYTQCIMNIHGNILQRMDNDIEISRRCAVPLSAYLPEISASFSNVSTYNLKLQCKMCINFFWLSIVRS